MINSIKKEKTEDLMMLSREMRRAVRHELDSAKKQAERILNAPIKKPAASDIERFQKQLGELKTLIALNPNPSRAKQQLTDFAASVTDAYLADMLRDEFGTLCIPIVAKSGGSDGARMQMELSDTYAGLKERFVTDEQKEARGIMESIEMLSESTVFKSIVVDTVKVDLGLEAARYINTPDDWFTMKAAKEAGA
ncbi:hypothetical protein [Bacillus sp. 3255]|uniref:hypothetical protein n=1 Tax=Bacillus sp. 3255 TaxID=2817904 RepID=UPI00286560AE|nr:hypothetical protein [Bacillus sp. 3255]MDR6883565.1 hypothetical protein [Bacillus sp. 3255]